MHAFWTPMAKLVVVAVLMAAASCGGASANGQGCGKDSDCASGLCLPHTTPVGCTAENCFGTCEAADAG